MTEPAAPVTEHQPPPPTPVEIQTWRFSRHAWRLTRRITRRHIDLVLRFRSARVMPTSARARFRAMGLPDDTILRILGEVRSLDGWSEAWIRGAQRSLGEARRFGPNGHDVGAAHARRQAALCYHAAQLLVFDDPRTARALRAAATTLFAQTAPILLPTVRRVDIPWRSSSLPAYLYAPPEGVSKAPLVVLLNGATTAKEETIVWADRFLAHGIAVLALDNPGTGEAWNLGPLLPDHDDVLDGVFEFMATESSLDERRAAVVGVDLGGAIAVRAAAYDRRLTACVAVTPPFDATRWIDSVNPLLLDQFAADSWDPDAVHELAAGFALSDAARRLRNPLLVMGGGRDLIIPPEEALRLCAAAGPLGTLAWYPNAGHGLYDILQTWTDDAARWLSVILGGEPSMTPAFTQVDTAAQPDAEMNPRIQATKPLRD